MKTFSKNIYRAHTNGAVHLFINMKRKFVKINSQSWLQCEIIFEQLDNPWAVFGACIVFRVDALFSCSTSFLQTACLLIDI